MSATATPLRTVCQLCTAKLLVGDDRTLGICSYCSSRPEAQGIRQGRVPRVAAPPRPFTSADRALIQRLHEHVPAVELLKILNDRLIADLGPQAPRYTMELLQPALASVAKPRAAGNWASLRRVIADARRCGVLATITPVVIDDFATVFQLTPAQVTALKDVIQHARDS